LCLLLSSFYYNIHKMMNITRNSLETAELNFVQAVASVFAPVGMPSSVGRVYGYLLLKQTPIGLDQIASDLSLSKGGAWNAARVLERYGQVQRYSEPGGKRAMYAPSENFGSSFLAILSLLGTFGNVLQGGAASVATGEASARLAARAKFHILLRQAMETAIIELNASCQSSRSSATGSRVGLKDSTVESVA
jgi:predicted transcriptional regulator